MDNISPVSSSFTSYLIPLHFQLHQPGVRQRRDQIEARKPGDDGYQPGFCWEVGDVGAPPTELGQQPYSPRVCVFQAAVCRPGSNCFREAFTKIHLHHAIFSI